jgi:type IV secretion system protein VirB6
MDSYLGISDIMNLVNQTIQTYTQTSYQALSGALAPTLQLLLALYVVIFGVQHLTGHMAFDFWRTVKHLVVMVLVTAFITHWDFFALYFGNLFTDGPGKLMALMSNGGGDPNALLGQVMDQGIMSANSINQMAGWSTLGFLIVGYSVFYMTLACVAYALYLLVLSKLALAILLGLAPLFFLFLLFNATRDFFVHYARQVFNFALIPVFTSAVLALMLKIPQVALTRLQTVIVSHNGHGGRECFFVLLSFAIVLLLLHQVTGFAAGVSGGGLHLHPGNVSAFALGAATSQLRRTGKAGKTNLGEWGQLATAPVRPVGRWMSGLPYRAGRRVAESLANRRPGDKRNRSVGRAQ